ncbi:uncharacterized protein LOC129317480 [Prosopis cineraria]|uniref:uncharacterized protein LOC129317480 n=1 Tax=Prosopis cineraria TaxID=364024 RepID=UPI0024106528|nr:uncharacterized protein LOC129317480 [Prosopis cineraria]
MDIICWNCRGTCSKSFPGRIKEITYAHNTQILILIETRASGSRADMIVKKLGFSDWIRVEATGYARGTWILWNNNTIEIDYIYSNVQILHCKVNVLSNNTSYLLSCVYGDPNPYERVALWDSITLLAQDISDSWLIVGDFNAYLSYKDKCPGSGHNQRAMKQFRDYINSSNLLELNFTGDKFTWGKGNVKERLDWAFCNIEWHIKFNQANSYHLLKYDSDHQPIRIQLQKGFNPYHHKGPFQCHAAWMLEESFHSIIKKS